MKQFSLASKKVRSLGSDVATLFVHQAPRRTTTGLLSAAASVGLLMACSNPTSATESFEQIQAQFQGGSIHETYIEATKVPGFNDIVAAWSETSFSEQIKAFLPRSSNARFAIDGLVFADLQKSLSSNQDAMRARDKKFSSIKGYWRSIGFNPSATISLSDFRTGLALMAQNQSNKRAASAKELRVIESARVVAFALATAAMYRPEANKSSNGLALDVVIAGNTDGPNVGAHAYDPNKDKVCVSTQMSSVESDSTNISWWLCGGHCPTNKGPKKDSLVYNEQLVTGGNYGLNKQRDSWYHLTNVAKADKAFYDCATSLVANWPSLGDKNADADLADKLLQAKPRAMTPGESVVNGCSSIGDGPDNRTANNNSVACWGNMQTEPSQN